MRVMRDSTKNDPDPKIVTQEGRGQSGIPVDAYGGQTIDPTKNVLDLVEAAIRRVDDLREAESTRVNEKLDLRTIYFDKVMDMTQKHTEEIANLRSIHTQELMDAEAKRIDAIRVVDVQAVSVANEKATAQATVLANQVQASAETLRTLVATNATALAQQLTQIITPITDRLALLEKAQYEGSGRQTVADPQLAQLLIEVRNLTTSRDTGVGRGSGQSGTWMIMIQAVGLISTVIVIFLALSGHIK